MLKTIFMQSGTTGNFNDVSPKEILPKLKHILHKISTSYPSRNVIIIGVPKLLKYESKQKRLKKWSICLISLAEKNVLYILLVKFMSG